MELHINKSSNTVLVSKGKKFMVTRKVIGAPQLNWYKNELPILIGVKLETF
jgi:hypothetical protein